MLHLALIIFLALTSVTNAAATYQLTNNSLAANGTAGHPRSRWRDDTERRWQRGLASLSRLARRPEHAGSGADCQRLHRQHCRSSARPTAAR